MEKERFDDDFLGMDAFGFNDFPDAEDLLDDREFTEGKENGDFDIETDEEDDIDFGGNDIEEEKGFVSKVDENKEKLSGASVKSEEASENSDAALSENTESSPEKMDETSKSKKDKKKEKAAKPVKEKKPKEKPVKPEKPAKAAAEEHEKKDNKRRLLYICTDEIKPDLLGYYRDKGLAVSRIFTNIQECKSDIQTQVLDTEIVVIDSGTGRFSSVMSRTQLVELAGLIDEDISMTFFYSDSLIRAELKDRLDSKIYKAIKWINYKNTPLTVVKLLKSGYEFYLDKFPDKEPEPATFERYAKLRGTRSEDCDIPVSRKDSSMILLSDIQQNMLNASGEDALQEFTPKY